MARILSFTLIVILFSISFLGCKTDKTDTSHDIHIRLKKDPERLNPLVFPSPTSREVYQYIHTPLADFDPISLELSPLLIKEIPQEMAIDTGKYAGGIYFDIEIKPEARWDDGSEITAHDYVFTLKSINLPLTEATKYREFAQNISDIVIDPKNSKKFKVLFAKDYMLALESCLLIEIYPRYFYDSQNLLGNYSYSDILNFERAQIEQDTTLIQFAETFNSNEFSRDKISGSGPYKLVSWVSDQTVVLERKENYWAKNEKSSYFAQGPQKMIFHVIPDEITAVAQLKAGQLDVINEISTDVFENLKKDTFFNGVFEFYNPALMRQYFVLLNMRDPVISEVNVRQALAHLIDVDDIINNLEYGLGIRTVGPIHPVKKTHHPHLKPIPFDVQKAQDLLTNAGWKDTDGDGILDKEIEGQQQNLIIELLISGQELGKKLAILWQQSAAQAGIQIEIVERDFKQIRMDNIMPRKYQMVLSARVQEIQMWDELMFFHSSNDTPDGSNSGSYRSPVVDSLLDKIIFTKDLTERKQIYHILQEEVYKDLPNIFLYSPKERIIVSKNWSSFATSKRPGYMANAFQYMGKGASIEQ